MLALVAVTSSIFRIQWGAKASLYIYFVFLQGLKWDIFLYVHFSQLSILANAGNSINWNTRPSFFFFFFSLRTLDIPLRETWLLWRKGERKGCDPPSGCIFISFLYVFYYFPCVDVLMGTGYIVQRIEKYCNSLSVYGHRSVVFALWLPCAGSIMKADYIVQRHENAGIPCVCECLNPLWSVLYLPPFLDRWHSIFISINGRFNYESWLYTVQRTE